jgi:signal transduction histidine kinase/CheY-like chemotaxis protein/AraC-like DNA-binding protein
MNAPSRRMKSYFSEVARRNFTRFLCIACAMLSIEKLPAQSPFELHSLHQNFIRNPQDTASVAAALRLGQIYFSTSTDSFLYYNGWAETFSRQKLADSTALHDWERRFYQRSISISLRETGYYQQRKRWDVDKALATYEEALAWAQQAGDDRSIALTFNNIANVYDNQGDLKTALDYYQQALKILEKTGGDALAICLDDIGKLNLSLGDLEKAEESCLRSLEVSEKIGAQEQICMAMIHLGGIYAEKSEFAKAEDFFKKALAIAQSEQNRLLLALAHRYRGVCLEKQDRKREALDFHQKGLQYAEGMNYIKGAALSHLYISKLLHEQRSEEAALQHARQSFDLSRQAGIPLNIKESAEWLSQLYSDLDKPAEALELYRLSVVMKDSIFNAGNRRSMIRQQMQYEFDKKETIAIREKKVQRTILIAVASCLLLSLLLAAIIWRNLQTKERQRRIIEAQKMEVEERNARISEASKTIEKQAQELRRLDEMKNRFFANISHEFRTPLTLMLGQVDSVISRIENHALKGRLFMASENGRRLLQLINQLLDLAKLESGKMQLHVAQQDLIPFLKNHFYAFESLAEKKRMRMEFHSEETALEAFFENEKMGKVFFNLLSNAMKFTEEGGSVTMRVSKKTPDSRFPDGFAEITVSDTGVGIPEDRLPYIFDRFYQVDDSNTREWEGTGIGLSLVKEFVELHHGEVSVESEFGKGTSFTVRLPLGDVVFKKSEIATGMTGRATGDFFMAETAGEEKSGENFPEGAGKLPPDLGNDAIRLLVVEDNPDMRSYLCDHLMEAGYHVTATVNGEEGLSTSLEHLPDLIISDVMMPRMDGYEMSRRLRSNERTSHIPIIMLTAKAGEEDKIEGLETGVDAYLTKPFSERELLVRVKNLVHLRRQMRERFSTATVIRPSEVSAAPMDQVFLKKVIETIEAHIGDEQFGVEPLSEAVSMSVTHLNRKLNALIDQTAGNLIRSMRLQRAAELLEKNAGSISEIAWQVGFSDAAHFTRSFKQQFGVPPSEWAKNKSIGG